MEDYELLPIVEGLLFVAGEPLTAERIAEVTEVGVARILETLPRLRERYDRGHGIELVEMAGGFQLRTRAECAPWIRRLAATRRTTRLSRAALETLALIVYRQPITRGEIESVRGVDSAGVIRTLLERKTIRIMGRKAVPGKPIVYGTTPQFLEYFGLKDLSELPTLKEFTELTPPLPLDQELVVSPEAGSSNGPEASNLISPPPVKVEEQPEVASLPSP